MSKQTNQSLIEEILSEFDEVNGQIYSIDNDPEAAEMFYLAIRDSFKQSLFKFAKAVDERVIGKNKRVPNEFRVVINQQLEEQRKKLKELVGEL